MVDLVWLIGAIGGREDRTLIGLIEMEGEANVETVLDV